MVFFVAAFFITANFVFVVGNAFGMVRLDWLPYLISAIPAVLLLVIFEVQKLIINSK